MSRFNPVFIIVALFILLIGTIFYDRSLQKEIAQKEKAIASLQKKAEEITALKRYWKEKKLQQARVAEFIRFASRFVTSKEQRGTHLVIHLDNIDVKNSDRIAEKLFGSFIRLEKVTIERKNSSLLSMRVEFGQ